METLAVLSFFAILFVTIICGFAFQHLVFAGIKRAIGEPSPGWDYLIAPLVGLIHASVWFMLMPEPVMAVAAALVAFLSPVYIRLSRTRSQAV